MYNGGSGAGRSVHVVPDRPDELDQGLGAVWDAVVGPHRVVEVTQDPRETAAALLWGVRSLELGQLNQTEIQAVPVPM